MRHLMSSFLLAALLTVAGSVSAAAEITYSGGFQRDPFVDGVKPDTEVFQRPTVTAESISDSVKVSGISYSDSNPKAIVNGKILGIGDDVGKLGKITRIEINGIAIKVSGNELFFKQTIGKKNDTTPSQITKK